MLFDARVSEHQPRRAPTSSMEVLGEHFALFLAKCMLLTYTLMRGWYMAYTFGLSFKKFTAADIGRTKGHNLRLHPTASQLQRPEAWFTEKSHYTIVDWDDSKIEKAKNLAKRKDAVQAIGVSVQLGSQIDWRKPPSEQFPEGEPIFRQDDLNNLSLGARAIADEIFGKDNVVSVELHTDESTPHVQFVATPIYDGKLQAKHWLNGAASCAALRRKACEIMNRFVECNYVPGNPGGEPHDPGKSAGAKSAPETISIIDWVLKTKEKELEAALSAANNRIRELEQALFSKQKARYTKEMIDTAKAAAAEAIAEKDAAVAAKNEAFAAKEAAEKAAQEARAQTERVVGIAKREIQKEKDITNPLRDEIQQLKIDLAEEKQARKLEGERLVLLDRELRRLKGNSRTFS